MVDEVDPARGSGGSASRDFWGQRFNRLGHTGWKRAAVYAYDQCERLAIIAAEIEALGLEPGARVLDFGCGSGEFTRLLLDKGLRVWAHDAYVKPRIQHTRLCWVGDQQDLAPLGATFDLVLCVTVLDHILDNSAFVATLGTLRSVVRPDGHLLLLEYATDAASARPTDYQAFRPLSAWREALSASGWDVAQVRPVPHPSEAPSAGYSDYARSLTTKALGLIAQAPTLQKPTAIFLRQHAARSFRSYGAGSVSASPLKLLLCRPLT